MPISRVPVVVVLVGIVAVAWVAVVGSQSQVPGVLTSGAAPVQVMNDVATRAAQAGPWQVSLAAGSAVGLVRDTVVGSIPPDFLRVGRRYVIHASGEAIGTFTVDAIDHGWVRAVGEDAASRWFNLGQIISIREAR